jgi:hypothetical protein
MISGGFEMDGKGNLHAFFFKFAFNFLNSLGYVSTWACAFVNRNLVVYDQFWALLDIYKVLENCLVVYQVFIYRNEKMFLLFFI